MVDATDLRILDILQHDASATAAEIGGAVGLSATPCWNRIQKLEADGARACADGRPHAETVARFVDKVRAMPEAINLHRLAGDFDFLLRLVAVGLRHFDAIYQTSTSFVSLRQMASYFELARLKSETALSLNLGAGALALTLSA